MGFRKKQVPVVSKFPLFWSTDILVGEKNRWYRWGGNMNLNVKKQRKNCLWWLKEETNSPGKGMKVWKCLNKIRNLCWRMRIKTVWITWNNKPRRINAVIGTCWRKWETKWEARGHHALLLPCNGHPASQASSFSVAR